MNIKKLLSAKLVDGKKQILVRVDVSRTIRPSLKTGIYVHPDLFDEENGVIRIPKNCRRNVELVKEAEDVNCALQSFCLRVTSLCQHTAVELGIEITKEWLISQIAGEKKSNNSKELLAVIIEPKESFLFHWRRLCHPLQFLLLMKVRTSTS